MIFENNKLRRAGGCQMIIMSADKYNYAKNWTQQGRRNTKEVFILRWIKQP